MNGKRLPVILSVAFLLFSLSACSLAGRGMKLLDAKITATVDDKLMPVGITDVFPKGTSKVSCWIKWKDARINTPLLAKWHYVTDDIHILSYNLSIPKKEGMGSIALTMPAGRELPPGRYKVDLITGKHIIRTLPFRIE